MDGYIDQLEFSNDGYIKAKGIAVAEGYVDLGPEQLEKIAQRLPNQPILYRHVHPKSPGNGDVFGVVRRAEVIEHDGKKKVAFEAELATHTDTQKKLVEYIKEKQETGDPVGISIGFVRYGNDVYPFDVSVTRIPVVKESGVMIEMEEEKTKLEKLEEALDLIKQKDEQIQKLLDIKTELEQKLEKVSVELEDTKKLAEAKKTDLQKAVEAKIAELEEKYTKKIEMLEKAPVIERIFALEGDEWLKNHVYPDMGLDKLKERLVQLEEKKKALGEAASKIVVDVNEMEDNTAFDPKKIDEIVNAAVASVKAKGGSA